MNITTGRINEQDFAASPALEGYGRDPRVLVGFGETGTKRSLGAPIGAAPCRVEGIEVAKEERSSVCRNPYGHRRNG